MLRKWIAFLLCFVCYDCLSQQYPFVHYTPKDGLVNNGTRLMFQDSRGLLYISTFGGLSVYDGSRFTNYTTDNGLSTNLINDVVEMGDDSIWIIPNGAKLQCLVKGEIKDVLTSDGFYPVINKMIKCSDGSYYALADEGLFRLEGNRFNKINLVDNSGRDVGPFFSNAVEVKGRLYIITDPSVQPLAGPGRLIVYDFKNTTVLVNRYPRIYFIASSPKGDVLVSTEQGIKKLDEAALMNNSIRLTSCPAAYRPAKNFIATYMYFDRQQNFWVASTQGVSKIDPSGHSIQFSIKNGLPVNNQSSVFEDKENIMWFVNGQTGISKLANPQFEFYRQIRPGFTISDIYADEASDSVWFLDVSRNSLLLQSGNESKEFQLPRHSIYPPFRMMAMKGGNYYLTDFSNIYRCHFSGNRIRLTVLQSIDNNRPIKIGFNCVLQDKYGDLLACSDSLFVLNQNRKPEFYPLGYFADNFVITKDEQIWVITRANKLFAFGIHPENTDHHLQLLGTYNRELPTMNSRSITVDKKGNVWIGSRDHGLFCLFFDGLTFRSWKQITVKDGLSDNFITYLHADDEGNIWAGSHGGLDKIQIRNGDFVVENITGSSNFYLHALKIQSGKNGILWAVTTVGIIKITPDTLHNFFHPKILFREIYEGRNRIDIKSAPRSFTYDQNNLSFSVAAPSFLNEKQIRFIYQLEGSRNKSWSDPTLHPVINFINLSPGKYILRVKALLLNSGYPDSEISYEFLIRPPWWQTLWFRLTTALLLAIIGWLMIRSYYRRKLYHQKTALEKQQAVEKERTRIAVDMHDDLGAGLSTIRFLSEKVKRNVFSEVTRGDIEKMQTTSNELIDKMNEIIWAMSEKNDSLEDLVLYMRSYSMEYCEENNLDCTIQLPENIPPVFVSGEMRRNIFLTVKESLHNIVKHACANKVVIQIEVSAGLDISIHDDGRGFKEHQVREMGNGLRNMRQRIESTGGSMNIQNEQGVRVNLKIPLL
jgi:signal transduction histidine kinase/ligand-binding sensor domain-containing protein